MMTFPKRTAVLGAVLSGAIGSAPALADETELLRQMKEQMTRMQTQIEAMEMRLKEQGGSEGMTAGKTTANSAKAPKAVQVYGQARLSVDNHSGDWATGQDGTEVLSNSSRLGVKGEMETAIDGTNLIYMAEIRYDNADSAKTQFEYREGFAGLKGDWGKARLGRLSTAYKSTGTKIDPWTDNAPQARAGGRQGMSELHSSYFNNALDYTSPKLLGGLAGSLWYATRFDESTKTAHNTGTLDDFQGGTAMGVGAKYENGPLFIGADWLDIDADTITNANLANDSGWQIAGRYDFGPVSFSALYEDVEDIGLGTNSYINGIYKTGGFRIIGAYGQNRDAAVYGNKDWNNLSLGVKYALTKKSELLAAWNQRTNDTDDLDFTTITLGVNAKFGY